MLSLLRGPTAVQVHQSRESSASVTFKLDTCRHDTKLTTEPNLSASLQSGQHNVVRHRQSCTVSQKRGVAPTCPPPPASFPHLGTVVQKHVRHHRQQPRRPNGIDTVASAHRDVIQNPPGRTGTWRVGAVTATPSAGGTTSETAGAASAEAITSTQQTAPAVARNDNGNGNGRNDEDDINASGSHAINCWCRR